MPLTRILRVLATLAVLFATLMPREAQADACDFSEFPLSCATKGPYYLEVEGSFFGGVSSWFTTDEYRDCGTTTDYGENQDVFVLTCIRTTEVTLRVQPTDCDVDLFVLNDSCNPNLPGSCVDSSINGGNATERANFTCQEGSIYYVSVERPDDDVLSDLCSLLDAVLCGLFGCDICPCTADEDFGYTIALQCAENCDNRWDDDGDGLEDCLDPDCPQCIETCDDRKDNDYDNLIDCEDPDCAWFDGCCDKDGDDWLAIGSICGGDDCNDSATAGGVLVNPGRAEIPADGVDQNCDNKELCYVDRDGDRWGISVLELSSNLSCLAAGYTTKDGDCDDTNPQIYPERTEIPVNGKDDNCDNLELCYLDQDGDDYGRDFLVSSTSLPCSAGNVSSNNDDCDDDNAFVHPGAPELPLSGFDEDCDGTEVCYVDSDGDGFGNPNATTSTPFVTCIGPGVSPDPRDCNDANPSIYPGATEVVADGVDADCDTLELCYTDEDNDTFGNNQGRTGKSPVLTCISNGFSPNRTDCDDSNVTIYPGALDPQGDGVDQNCDGLQECFADADGDGFGGTTLVLSSAPSCVGVGIAPVSGDCNDSNIAINPGATETPVNNVDQNCNGTELCYVDQDLDTFGRDQLVESVDLTCAASGVSRNNRDCNDNPPEGTAIFPGQTEVALNGFDDNCDGLELCYKDGDADRYGNAAGTLVTSGSLQCNAAGVSSNTDDCNDADARINPGATEVPVNNRDEDCDGSELCYLDADRDNFGNDAGVTVESTILVCTGPLSGVSTTRNDCNDGNPQVYPGAPTPPGAPGGVDYSCSGFTTCFADQDDDGYGAGAPIAWADPNCGGSFVSPTADDCNDSNPAIKPGATEIGTDSVDQNCDGFELCYQDLDADGHGSIITQLSTDITCNSAGVSQLKDDCNDNPANNGASIYPGAPELTASGYDEDCNGTENCYLDFDQDSFGRASPPSLVATADVTCRGGAGYADNALDCNDNNFSANPGKPEIPANGIDENCDAADDCYIDVDLDGYGRASSTPSPFGLLCIGPGVSQNALDCLDIPPQGALVYPGAPEIPANGLDENCDTREVCYLDLDQDSWGGTATVQSANLLCLGTGISARTGDCNENDNQIHPGAVETPANNRDQNCDLKEDCYRDQDLDDFGTVVIIPSTDITCTALGVANNDDDCYDVPPDGASVYPGAAEIIGNLRDDNCDGSEGCYLDGDGDSYGRNIFGFTQSLTCAEPGYSAFNTDCNDLVASINPGAIEIPADNLDQDCDLFEDCYLDIDGDRFGQVNTTPNRDFTCTTLGVSPNDDDCGDFLPGGNFIYPNAPEILGDGVDQDCNGAETCYVDADGDSWGGTGSAESLAFDCVGPNSAARGGDCNDSDVAVYPGATEIPADGKDQDCNGGDACYQDIDDDGFGSANVIPSVDLICTGANEAAQPGDCVDSGTINGVRAREINPDAIEQCNEVDDDCDGLVDDDDGDLTTTRVWFPDEDVDGYGNTDLITISCVSPGSGFTTVFGDCDDADELVNPGADELCDDEDVDEDCDGKADNLDVDSTGKVTALGAVTLHPDVDGDLFGNNNPAAAIVTCDPGPGLVVDATDCLDTNANVNPSKSEVPYNGLDDDCDAGTPDDDLDGDGYTRANDCNDNPSTGNNVNPGASEGTQGNGIDDDCDGKIDEGTNWGDDDNDGFSEAGGDCNDNNRTTNPGATELPNGVDDDCDGTIDEGTTRYDDDADGYTEVAGDCNDGDAGVNPGVREVCPGTDPNCSDGIDNDCNGSVDGGTFDPDGDGYTEGGGDCLEGNPAIFPGAPEIPNGKDDDCDDLVDEGTNQYDDDGDGFTELQGDCNDNNEQVYPGASEGTTPDGIDQDCDGRIDEGLANSDDDGDGFSEIEGDCDDNNAQVFPGGVEVTNGVDDDCDGEIDENGDDKDEDGYTVAEGDCDDNNGWANPQQPEVCDQVDNDCDGDVDEGSVAGGPSICDEGSITVKPETDCTQGCSNSGSGSPAWIVGLALVLARRRQRRAA